MSASSGTFVFVVSSGGSTGKSRGSGLPLPPM